MKAHKLIWKRCEDEYKAEFHLLSLGITFELRVYRPEGGSTTYHWFVMQYEYQNEYQQSNAGPMRSSNSEFPPGSLRQAKAQARAALVMVIREHMADLALIIAACDLDELKG